MADYWKSQPRKFCQYCKCWIADNKPSIDFHERGKNHKENVASKISEIKKKSIAKAKQEKKMSKDFAKMEAAAQLAYAEDLRRLSGEILPAADAPATTPPQPKPQKPTKPPKAQKKSNSRSSGGQGGGRAGNGFQSAWVEGVADDGNVYYYNTMTGESRWVQPDIFFAQRGIGSVSTGNAQSSAESSWIEAVSPEGYNYYYNAQTGESSWEKPTKSGAQDKPADDEKEDGKKQIGEEPSPQEESRSAANADNPSDSTEPAENTKTSISSRKRKEDEGDDVKKKTTADPDKPSETAALVINITPAKKTRKNNPYGAWEQVQPKEDPYEKVDLQLPEPDLPAPVLPVAPVEPKTRFKERVITSLGVENSAGATFRKKKTDGNKFRSLRKRDADE